MKVLYFHLGTRPVVSLSQPYVVTFSYNNFVMKENYYKAGVRFHNAQQGSNRWFSATLAYEPIAPMTCLCATMKVLVSSTVCIEQ